MRAEVNHRTLEPRISHHRHGDQQLTVEITASGRIVASAGGFAAGRFRSFAFRIHPQRTLTSRHILILGGGSVNQASGRVNPTSQAIQWFAIPLAYKDRFMMDKVPMRAAPGFAATLFASSLTIAAMATEAFTARAWAQD